MMLDILFAAFVVFVLLVFAEWLRRKQHIRGELARKFVHISVGTFVAFTPFFMSWLEIQLLCVAFIIVVMLDRHLHVLKSIHSVKRQTIGDILFPVGVGLVTLITHTPWIFTAAILHLSLGDGIAAVVGQHYAKTWYYTLLRQRKSYLGSGAFYVVSLVIMIGVVSIVSLTAPHGVLIALVAVPVAATLLESVSIFGVDNVLVPVLVAYALTALQ